MSYNALRIGRTSIPGQIYLVTTVTTDRAPLFNNYFIDRVVVQSMRSLDISGACRTLAFVVMPDHLHWLFELNTTQSLAQVIKLLKGRTSAQFRKYLHHNHKVWQSSFHDHAVRTDESLIEIARYVIMNPVRAGLVTRIGDYPLWDCIWI